MTTLPRAPQWYTTRPGALQPAELLTGWVGKCVRRRKRNSPCTYLYLGYIFCSWDINKASCRDVVKVLGQEAYLVSYTVPSGHSPAGYPELEIPPQCYKTRSAKRARLGRIDAFSAAIWSRPARNRRGAPCVGPASTP